MSGIEHFLYISKHKILWNNKFTFIVLHQLYVNGCSCRCARNYCKVIPTILIKPQTTHRLESLEDKEYPKINKSSQPFRVLNGQSIKIEYEKKNKLTLSWINFVLFFQLFKLSLLFKFDIT